MKLHCRSFVLSVMMLVGSFSLSARAIQQASPASAAESVVVAGGVQSSEVLLLKQQLEDSRKFQEQILTTVYWSLGGLATMAAALVGFGWFANFKVYERDKASLERDLKSIVNEEMIKTRAESKDFSTRDRKQAYNSIAGDVDRKLAAIKSNIESSVRSLKSDVLELQLKEEIKKHHVATRQKVYRNALQSSVSSLEIANEIGWENSVADVLDLVTSDIASIMNSDERPIDNFLVAQLVSALSAVKGVHAHAAASLKSGSSALLTK